MTKVLEQFRSNYSATQAEEVGIEEYLELCKREPATYASAAEPATGPSGQAPLATIRLDC